MNRQQALIAAMVVCTLLAAAGLLWHGRRGDATAGDHGDHSTPTPRATAGTDGHAASARGAGQGAAREVTLSAEQVRSSGIEVRTSGPARLGHSIQLPGEIRFNEDRTAHVVPRLGGVVQAVPANLGQGVKRGQVIAVIASTALAEQRSELRAAQRRLALARITHDREMRLWQQRISAEQDYLQATQALEEAEIAVTNASQKLAALGADAGQPTALNRFELRAPFDGLVVEKHIALGEAVKEDTNIFTISDLSSVWAEMLVAAKDLPVVRVGEKVTVRATAFDAQANGTVAYVGALLGEQTRAARARVLLANPRMAWRPGLFVTVEVSTGQTDAAVTVEADALQTHGSETVVFQEVPGGFRATAVTTGRSDGQRVEVLRGLAPGARYAARNSFVLAAELGKRSTTHD